MTLAMLACTAPAWSLDDEAGVLRDEVGMVLITRVHVYECRLTKLVGQN